MSGHLLRRMMLVPAIAGSILTAACERDVAATGDQTPAPKSAPTSAPARASAAEPEPAFRCLVTRRPLSLAAAAAGNPAPLAAPHDTGLATIDALAMYTTDAVASLSANDVRSRVTTSVEWTNKAFTCSGVRAQLRLVGVEPLPFAMTGTMKSFLADKLSNETTAEGKALLAARKLQAADVVIVIVGGTEYQGLAHVADAGVTRSWWPDATVMVTVKHGNPGWSLAHEIGHMMGAGHEREGPPDGSYAHAWIGANNRFTIMATGGGQLVARYSSPDVQYLGQTVGVANEADNVRAMNERRRIVEGWVAPLTARLAVAIVPCP